MVNRVRGIGRYVTIALVIGLGTVAVLLTSWLPWRVQGARPCSWIATGMCRFFLWLFNIELTCENRETLRQHTGFIFPNHTSYLDIIILMSIFPMRWLAAAEIGQWPFIGRIGHAIDTVFVQREDKNSRAATRAALKGVPLYPPLCLFPEGGIISGQTLGPFRYGAFEIVQAQSAAYIPAAIVYVEHDVMAWRSDHGEHVMAAAWRLARHGARLHARLVPLPVIQTSPDDNPRALAEATHSAIWDVLRAAYANG